MDVTLGGWGVPDFGNVHVRSRLLELLGSSGTQPCVLFGSSGAGKSVVAAQYCAASSGLAVWIDAGGGALSLERLAASTIQALGQSSELLDSTDGLLQPADCLGAMLSAIGATGADSGVTIVLDDFGAAATAMEVADLWSLAKVLRTCSSRLVVTTRSTANWPADLMCSWNLIGPDDLALTAQEAAGLIESAGVPSLIPQAADLREACSGHVAVFAVLANQAAKYGVKSAVERTASLEAWLRQLLQGAADDGTKAALVFAGLLGTGDSNDLRALGVPDPESSLSQLMELLPLVHYSRDGNGSAGFRVHDLVHDFILDELASGRLMIDPAVVGLAVERLTMHKDLAKAASVMGRLCEGEVTAEWLQKSGGLALSDGAYRQLQTLLESLAIHVLMARPKVLMLWAELSAEMGRTEDALNKCNAVRSLTEHIGDAETLAKALSLSMQCLCRLYRFDEAQILCEELLGSSSWQSHARLRGEALMCLARARLTRGEDTAGISTILEEAVELSATANASSHTRHILAFLSALVPILSQGDWIAGARILTPLMHMSGQLVSSRIMTLGNLGLMLTEAGRLTKSQALLRAAVAEARRHGLDAYIGAYSPTLGYATVGAGAIGEGLALIEEGIALSTRLGDLTEAATDKVHYSTVLRSLRRADESLVEAEQAFAVLTPADNIGFRQLAALEVAASLVALGDYSAARRWLDSLATHNLNPYQALRATIIAALIDRRTNGSVDWTLSLATHSEYIRSGNANWQLGMYCRAFPELLGMLALAVGVEELPSHLLRMVLPEYAEEALNVSRDMIGAEAWRSLGGRLLGRVEFSGFESRDGLPLCHVRMFGGLEVSVGGRTVRERDWRKRKARLLFCMLVVRNGHDVARDRLFEYLWPEMDEEHAKGNMYVVWSAIKGALGRSESTDPKAKCPYVESLGGVCRSVRDFVRTDVGAFDIAISEARAAELAGSTDAAVAAYRKLIDIYQGELLPGDLYDDWFAGTRDHYRLEFIDAMISASRIQLANGDPTTGLMYARRALQQDLSREDLYQAALRCQIRAGQRSSAIDTYMQCKARLSEELGLDPSPETRALYGEILAMEDRGGFAAYDPFAD